MIEFAKNGRKYFNRSSHPDGTPNYTFKPLEQFRQETGLDEKPSKRYFESTDLHTLVTTYPFRRGDMTAEETAKEVNTRAAFIDFLFGCLRINPLERWTPAMARDHPFLTGAPFTAPYMPRAVERRRAPSTPFLSSSSSSSPGGSSRRAEAARQQLAQNQQTAPATGIYAQHQQQQYQQQQQQGAYASPGIAGMSPYFPGLEVELHVSAAASQCQTALLPSEMPGVRRGTFLLCGGTGF